MPFLLAYWRPLAGLAVLLAIVAGIIGYGHSRYAAGEAAGKAHVKKAWDAAALAQRTAYAEAAAAAAQKEADQRKAAEEIEHDLRTKLSAADAGGRSLARRLHDYQASARGCPVPGAAPSAGQPAGSGGEPARAAAIGRASEDAFATCARDAERLNGYDAWAKSVGLQAQ